MNERLPSPTLFFQTCYMLAIKNVVGLYVYEM